MSIYFVDYENVHENGMRGLEQLKPQDTLCLLYSNSAQSLTIDTMSVLTQKGVKIKYFKCLNSGKNYLDFQLATVCGLMAGSLPDTDFVIVSGDKGFKALVDFWDGQEYLGKLFTCKLQGSIQEIRKNSLVRRKGQSKEVKEVKPERKKESQSVKNEIKIEVQPAKSDIKIELKDATIESPQVQSKEVHLQGKKQGTLQKAGITNISDLTKKKVRQAVKALELKPSEYTVIYQGFLKSTSESDFKNRLMQSIGKEQGIKVYENVLQIYQGILRDITNKVL